MPKLQNDLGRIVTHKMNGPIKEHGTFSHFFKHYFVPSEVFKMFSHIGFHIAFEFFLFLIWIATTNKIYSISSLYIKPTDLSLLILCPVILPNFLIVWGNFSLISCHFLSMKLILLVKVILTPPVDTWTSNFFFFS